MTTLTSLHGFIGPNLFRMHMYYETFCANEKISPLARQLVVLDQGDEA